MEKKKEMDTGADQLGSMEKRYLPAQEWEGSQTCDIVGPTVGITAESFADEWHTLGLV